MPADFADLDAAALTTVVINVRTNAFTALALASAVRHAHAPVVLVDCGATEEGGAQMARFAEDLDVPRVVAPLRPHGQALDALFRSTRSEALCLLDSDAELTSSGTLDRMRQALEDDRVFGSGWTHGPEWLLADHDRTRGQVLYEERPWVPCVTLRVSSVRDALSAGHTMAASTVWNEAGSHQRVGRLLAKRWDVAPGSQPGAVRRRLQQFPLRGLGPLRSRYYGLKPSSVFRDTGAEVYQYLKHEKGLLFDGTSIHLSRNEVLHEHGMTRQHLHGLPGSPAERMAGRLRDVYGLHLAV